MKPPAFILHIAALAMLVLALLPLGTTYELSVGATYYVFRHRVLFLPLSALLLAVWVLYRPRFTSRISPTVIWLHLFLTISCLVALLYFQFSRVGPSRYVELADQFEWRDISFMAFVMVQIVFFLYLFISVRWGR
jgi:hypothetical protein